VPDAKNKGVDVFTILIVVAVIVLIAGIAYNGWRLYGYLTPPSSQGETASSELTGPGSGESGTVTDDTGSGDEAAEE